MANTQAPVKPAVDDGPPSAENQAAEQRRLDYIAEVKARREAGDDLPSVAQAEEMLYAPLLDLSTEGPALADRPRILIDGEVYYLKLTRDFGIIDQQQLAGDGQEFDTLFAKRQLTNKEKKRLKQLLDILYYQAVDAPHAILEKLDDEQRAQVVTTFTFAPSVIEARKARLAEAKAIAEAEASQISDT